MKIHNLKHNQVFLALHCWWTLPKKKKNLFQFFN